MRVIALSQDVKILEDGETARRVSSYGTIARSFTIVLFSQGERGEKALAKNVRILASGGSGKISVFFQGIKVLWNEVKKNPPDLLSVQDPFLIGFAGFLVAWLRHIPFQAQVHADCFSHAFRSESFRRFTESHIARFILKRASCIRVVSKRLADSVKSITKAPVSILPIRFSPPSESTFAKPAVFSGSFTALMVSRLTKEKQVHRIIDAVSKTSEVSLVIVGDGPLKKSLESRVHSLGIEKRVTFVGWQKDTSPYYAHADVFLQASLHDGYGLSLIEAASFGLPIVSTNVGIVGDILRVGEEVLIAEDAPEFSNALKKLMEDRQLRVGLAAQAKKRAMEYTLSEEEYLKGYKEALQTCIANP